MSFSFAIVLVTVVISRPIYGISLLLDNISISGFSSEIEIAVSVFWSPSLLYPCVTIPITSPFKLISAPLPFLLPTISVVKIS